MPTKYSSSDRNLGNTSMPGTRQQKPVQDYEIRSADRKRVISRLRANPGGIAGGPPTDDPRELERRIRFYEDNGYTESAKAARIRLRNLQGHKGRGSRQQSSNFFQSVASFLGY